MTMIASRAIATRRSLTGAGTTGNAPSAGQRPTADAAVLTG